MAILKNARHERYCVNRAKGMTIDDAFVAAGFKRNRSNASQLNAKQHIQDRIAELMAPAAEAAELSAERTLKEVTRLAFYDMTQILDSKNGVIAMRDPTSLPEDLRRAIIAIKPVLLGDGLQYECKFADKQKALDSLMRHLQLFKDTLVIENVFRVVQEMDDDELNRRLAELERAFADATALDPAAIH